MTDLVYKVQRFQKIKLASDSWKSIVVFSMQYIHFFTRNWPNYFDEIYAPLEINRVHTSSSYQKFSVPHRRTDVAQKALPYVRPSL